MKKAFSTIDILMYLTFMAMVIHYAKPSYEEIMLRIQSQQYIHPLRLAQLNVEEYFFFQQDLPESINCEPSDKFEISWDGQSYNFSTIDGRLELVLSAEIEDYRIHWTCSDGQYDKITEYICHAIT